MQVAVQTHLFTHLYSIIPRGVGEQNSQARQFAQPLGHTGMPCTQLAHRGVELVGLFEKMVRVGAMVFHHAKQGCTITQPVMGAHGTGLRRVQVQMTHQVLCHLTVDLRQNETGSIVQGVVEVKQVHFARQVRTGTTNITNAQNV